jgi:alkylation response protein AidB-like acyl-CoA dehydrogenase
MTTTLITTGLDVIFGALSIATAIIAMMAIGAANQAMSYARNPYLRQRRIKVLQRKASAAFAFSC